MPEVTNALFPTPSFTVSTTDLRERFLLPGVFYLMLLILREVEDFPRGNKHFKHVPLPTYQNVYMGRFYLSFTIAQICE